MWNIRNIVNKVLRSLFKITFLFFLFLKVDEMFGFLPVDEKQMGQVPTAFKVFIYSFLIIYSSIRLFIYYFNVRLNESLWFCQFSNMFGTNFSLSLLFCCAHKSSSVFFNGDISFWKPLCYWYSNIYWKLVRGCLLFERKIINWNQQQM